LSEFASSHQHLCHSPPKEKRRRKRKGEKRREAKGSTLAPHRRRLLLHLPLTASSPEKRRRGRGGGKKSVGAPQPHLSAKRHYHPAALAQREEKGGGKKKVEKVVQEPFSFPKHKLFLCFVCSKRGGGCRSLIATSPRKGRKTAERCKDLLQYIHPHNASPWGEKGGGKRDIRKKNDNVPSISQIA